MHPIHRGSFGALTSFGGVLVVARSVTGPWADSLILAYVLIIAAVLCIAAIGYFVPKSLRLLGKKRR